MSSDIHRVLVRSVKIQNLTYLCARVFVCMYLYSRCQRPLICVTLFDDIAPCGMNNLLLGYYSEFS